MEKTEKTGSMEYAPGGAALSPPWVVWAGKLKALFVGDRAGAFFCTAPRAG